MVDWDDVSRRLRSDPPRVHGLRPPCPEERIREEESRLGPIPKEMAEMLRRFNGGEFFLIDAMPFVTIFGLSLDSDPPDFDWFLDRFTPEWRRSGAGRSADWAIAMTNYGGVAILGADSLVGEWDTSQRKWEAGRHPFGEWIEKILGEGAVYLNEV